MNDEEIKLLQEIVSLMENGKLTRKEKIIFVLGIQGGLYSSDKKVKEQLNKVADICLTVDTDYEIINEVKDFNN